MSESEIEAKIVAAGKTGPRLTPDDIDRAIVGEYFHVIPDTTVTVCALYLRNGFVVIGESAAASANNFDEEIGRSIARQHAREKIWVLEGYLLRQKLREAE